MDLMFLVKLETILEKSWPNLTKIVDYNKKENIQRIHKFDEVLYE